MKENEERALRAISRVLDWAPTAEHAWDESPFHVDGMHPRAERLILDGIEDASLSSRTSPLGVVIQGEGGAGKTHLLGWVRSRIAEAGGYFFLVDFSAGDDFWRRTSRAIIEDLGRPAGGAGAPIQAIVALRGLAAHAGVSGRIEAAVSRDTGLTREDLDTLVNGLTARDRRLLACRDTIRALTLYAAASGQALEIARDYLTTADEAEDGDRRAWGMSKGVKSPHDIVSELSTLLALTGPSVIAVDQIDAMLKHSRSIEDAEPFPGVEPRKGVIDEIAGGLMALRHTTHRTLCLVACLPSSWTLIKDQAVGTARDRFRPALILDTITNPEIARRMIERRFAVAFANAGHTASSPTWPILPAAFETAPGQTPRTLLQRVSAHVEACRTGGLVTALAHFNGDEPTRMPRLLLPAEPQADLSRLDARFFELRAEIEVEKAFDPDHEDEVVPPLLIAGLNAWIMEQGETGRVFTVDPLPGGRKPSIHARLRQVLDSESEIQRHWVFRMIGAPQPNAALSRLKHGTEESGLGPDVPNRCFVVLRNIAWSDGQATQTRLAALKECGGRSLTVRGDDLRVFAALRQMASDGDPDFDTWLRIRRPASRTELFTIVLEAPAQHAPYSPPPLADPEPSSPTEDRTAQATPEGPSAQPPAAGPILRVPVGKRYDTGTDLEVKLSTLARHTAVFAGSGSGKTVFIRRLVEECALLGVSSIILDSNNDLARLGDRWPTAPSEWSADETAKAERYFAGTDVVIWTPGRLRGRPLSFRPLPDFAAVLDDHDELVSALNVAVETLAPRAGIKGETAKALKGKAVLRQALEHFARTGGGDFPAFLAMLGDLPLEAGRIDRADHIAAELGQVLTAATINDPLFAGAGEPMDPARLLTPVEGKRARVSVISLIGLTDDAKPGFVSQLQMALFSWIKRNPARGRPLSGLYVMDEAQSLVPATPRTEALSSTLTLASQARKYGLGLVFATQAPRGLHNRIAGNATTQFIGRMNSPTQITDVQTLARSRGGRADRVGRLETGQFYTTTDGVPEVLIQAPQCLSHHPADPLTEEEIMWRASA